MQNPYRQTYWSEEEIKGITSLGGEQLIKFRSYLKNCSGILDDIILYKNKTSIALSAVASPRSIDLNKAQMKRPKVHKKSSEVAFEKVTKKPKSIPINYHQKQEDSIPLTFIQSYSTPGNPYCSVSIPDTVLEIEKAEKQEDAEPFSPHVNNTSSDKTPVTIQQKQEDAYGVNDSHLDNDVGYQFFKNLFMEQSRQQTKKEEDLARDIDSGYINIINSFTVSHEFFDNLDNFPDAVDFIPVKVKVDFYAQDDNLRVCNAHCLAYQDHACLSTKPIGLCGKFIEKNRSNSDSRILNRGTPVDNANNSGYIKRKYNENTNKSANVLSLARWRMISGNIN